MRISDWSSDVCSSDLKLALRFADEAQRHESLTGVLVVQHSMTMGESAAANILPGHPHFVVAVDQTCIGQQFRTAPVERSEERRVGQECVRTCRSRWSPYN